MKIVLAGGGSGGPVSPLLALTQEFRRRSPRAAFLWIGTNSGPEKKLVDLYQIEFRTISCGKLRRYASLKNILDFFRIVVGFFQSILLILRWRPDWIISAGGYVAVPLIWAGRALGVKILVHQQDVVAGLANRLTAPAAKIVTVTFPESQKYFGKKAVLTGNPVRPDVLTGSGDMAHTLFGLELNVPTILITGGGTGAFELNKIVNGCRAELVQKYQVIHLTGGKAHDDYTHPRYHQFDFLADGMKHALAVADVVVTRAGASALTELTRLQKPIIVVPIPDSHQVANARLYEQHKAAVVLDQKVTTSEVLYETIDGLMIDIERRKTMKNAISNIMASDSASRIVSLVL